MVVVYEAGSDIQDVVIGLAGAVRAFSVQDHNGSPDACDVGWKQKPSVKGNRVNAAWKLYAFVGQAILLGNRGKRPPLLFCERNRRVAADDQITGN